ncbi:MAG: alanine--tRNA ligase [Gammaproteobacteria bacterium]
MMTSAEVRSAFIDFFRGHGHAVVPSSSLVPANDPTLLFTNAGMVQFKDVFLGLEHRPYTRAVSSQRCVRAGGKHNDLENVGYTARHHTFFEMLGNFSFGDYFKREAIQYAWEFLTQVLKLPPERLWITVFEEDDEAADIWLKEIKVDPARFSRIGAHDNFWSMGDTGPCGPCSEIFYDHGPAVAGGPPGSPEADGDRYIEIWNLVFMQYNRAPDGTLTPLPKPSVDTGMGLERLAAVMQHVHGNYEIDLFRNLIRAVAQLAGVADLGNNSLKVVADHIRAGAFLIADGVMPSNEGRGYVLRRIIRRAIRHGNKLGIKDAFFYKLVAPLVAEMGAAYPELTHAQQQVERMLRLEEERFAETLEHGLKILEQDISKLAGKVIPGATVFRLYDTYGFPVDLTGDIAREHGLTLDTAGFEREMEAQRERARAASQFDVAYAGKLMGVEGSTDFTGYEHLAGEAAIVALYRDDGTAVNALESGQAGKVILNRTPFYAESGGQAGDGGVIKGGQADFEVHGTQKQGEGVHIHNGALKSGALRVGDKVQAQVNAAKRQAIALNHSATHLLHAALRQVLGPHVAQKGSLVEAERLRFDFSHFEPLSPAQVRAVERLVNGQIRANCEAQTRVMSYDEAVAAGAMALFGEKYGDQVRVLSIGEFSTELCGGTHVRRAGDIGLFKFVSEAGVASGVRRIEAITGQRALEWVEEEEDRLLRIADAIKAGRDNVDDKVGQLVERARKLEKELEQIKGKLASNQGSDLAAQAVEINGIKVLAACLEGVDPKALRDTVDQLKNKLGSAAVVLAAVADGKVSLVAGVTKDCIAQVKAGELVNMVALQVGGKGGGRPDMAQAGGDNPAALAAALAAVPEWVRQQLA